MDRDEITKTKDLLSKLEPGYLPEQLFYEFTRLSVSAILELVPLRKNNLNEIEVLVLKREEGDPHWPGMLHTPGTMLRPTDADDFTTAFERVFSEISRDYREYSIQKVGIVFHAVNRGKELSVIFVVEIADKRSCDNWVRLSQIDSHIVDTQVDFVNKAAEIFSSN